MCLAVRPAAGFTLIEMMVAAGILGLVVAGVMQTFVAQNHAYTVVDQTTEAQQNLRAISNLLEHDIRATGFMVPEGSAVCAVDQQNGPDTLFVTDADPINPTSQTRPQLGATVTGGSYSGALGTKTINVDNVVLDGTPFYDTNNDGVADADFRINGGAILIDADNPARGTACGVVTAVNPGGNALTINFQTTIGAPPLGERIVVVPAHVYAIAQRGPAANPTFTLTRDGRDIAADVEDLQVAFFFDVDNNGQMGAPAAENPGSAAGNPYVSSAWDNRQLREVRLNVVVRSRDPDPTDRQGLTQATENRAAAAATDQFRRRVHTATVRLRNVGFRGVAS
jgi:prepilin-type N-terminal cleavage/methylation domain-containing protein